MCDKTRVKQLYLGIFHSLDLNQCIQILRLISWELNQGSVDLKSPTCTAVAKEVREYAEAILKKRKICKKKSRKMNFVIAEKWEPWVLK